MSPDFVVACTKTLQNNIFRCSGLKVCSLHFSSRQISPRLPFFHPANQPRALRLIIVITVHSPRISCTVPRTKLVHRNKCRHEEGGDELFILNSNYPKSETSKEFQSEHLHKAARGRVLKSRFCLQRRQRRKTSLVILDAAGRK